MLKIRKLAEILVDEDSFDTPGSEMNLAVIDRTVKELLNNSYAHILDRPGTRYVVQVEVDASDEFPELQDLNRRF
jgi:hypothetical protein